MKTVRMVLASAVLASGFGVAGSVAYAAPVAEPAPTAATVASTGQRQAADFGPGRRWSPRYGAPVDGKNIRIY